MKRIVSAILCVIMLTGSLCIWAQADVGDLLPFMDDKTYSAGDINDDGVINALDSHALVSKVAGFGTKINTFAADLNADGKANSRDNLILKALFAGMADISDYTSESPVYSLTVGGNPISDYDITVPEGTTLENDNVYVAAKILQTYIKAAAGFDISIVNGDSQKPHTIKFHAIEPASAESEKMGLGLEDYIYEVKDGDLRVYGTLRGNMYAAYELCEKYLGLRFYDDSYTYSYRLRTSDIPEGIYEYHKVPLEFRFTGIPVGNTETVYQLYFARRQNGTQIYVSGDKKSGYLTGPRFSNAHSFYIYKAIMAGSYPEDPGTMSLREQLSYKYLDGQSKINMSYYECQWQPCASSDLAYYEMYNGMLEATEMVQEWGTNLYTDDIAKLGIYSVSFSLNDNGEFCNCSTCTAKANGNKIKTRGSMLAQLDNYSGEYTLTTENNKEYVTFKKESYVGLYMDLAVRAAKEITTEYHGYDYEFEDFPPLREDIRKVYPDIKVYLMTYDFNIPESVRPAKNMILIYCGHACNNHILGTGDCGDNSTNLGSSNKINEKSMPLWAQYCHEAGASLWYWSYGITYSYYLAPCPNIPDFYYNMKYLYEECGFDGVYYESCSGPHNNFEDMKSYLAAQVMWEPGMTYEEFTDIVKEYMYMYYGDGYEYIYDYMLMQTAAGDAAGCFVNNYDRPADMYSYEYLRGHWEEMRNDILTAIEMAGDSYHKRNCERLFPACEFMGLSAAYNTMYVKGSATQRAEYEKRYTDMYNYLADEENEVWIYPNSETYDLPEDTEIYDNPMNMFYGFGSWKEYVK